MKCVHMVLGTVAVAATCAQADLFIFEQVSGTFEVTAEDDFSRTIEFETTVDFEIGGLGITEIDGEFVQTFTGGDFDTIEGEAEFEGPSDLDTISVEFAGTLFDNGFSSFAGEWDMTASTGVYAVYTSGSGNNSGSYFFLDEDSGSFFAIFQGELVPAPGSLALAGLALAAATRRRRA